MYVFAHVCTFFVFLQVKGSSVFTKFPAALIFYKVGASPDKLQVGSLRPTTVTHITLKCVPLQLNSHDVGLTPYLQNTSSQTPFTSLH